MDDNAKIVNQNSSPVVADNQAQPQTQQVPAQPVAPVGSVNKEAAPISSTLSELKPAGAEASHDISQELKDMGVVERKDVPHLDNSHKSIGIQHSGASAPIQTATTGKVSLPMSDEEVLNTLKTGQDNDSKKGLAKLIDKIIKAVGL